MQTLCPCFVDTKICLDSNAGKQVGLVFPSPETFAASAIATVGITSLATGYWPHEFQVSVIILYLFINTITQANFVIAGSFIKKNTFGVHLILKKSQQNI